MKFIIIMWSIILWLLHILARADSYMWFESVEHEYGPPVMHRSEQKPSDLTAKTFDGVLEKITLGLL